MRDPRRVHGVASHPGSQSLLPLRVKCRRSTAHRTVSRCALYLRTVRPSLRCGFAAGPLYSSHIGIITLRQMGCNNVWHCFRIG